MKKLDFSLFLPIIITLLLLIEGYILFQLNLEIHPFIYACMLGLFFASKFLVGILQIIFNLITENENVRTSGEIERRVSFISNNANQSNESSYLMFFYYFLIGCLDAIGWSYYFYPTYLINVDKADIIMEIIPKSIIPSVASFFWIKLLNNKLYSHHIFALILNFIAVSTSLILMLLKVDAPVSYTLTWILFGISCCAFISFKEAGEKWLMFYKYRTQGLIIFTEGTIGLVSCCLFILYYFIFKNKIFNVFFEDIKSFFKEERIGVFLIIFYFSVSALLHILFITMNNKYNPTLRFIADSVYCFQFLVLVQRDYSTILLFTAAIPNFCAALIYNEIIVIPFCKLDYNTKIGIDERERIERKKAEALRNNVEDDFPKGGRSSLYGNSVTTTEN